MEEWRPAKGFEEYFEVSTLVRVKSLPKRVYDIARGWVTKPEQIIGRDGKSRYKTVGIRKGRKRITISIHRLVATTFIPNPDNLPVVNHIDGNTWNNAVSNLEWVTVKENVHHAIRTGLTHFHHKLNEDNPKFRQKEPDVLIQYDNHFNPVAEYKNVREAERKTGLRGIVRAKARCKPLGGFYWEYKSVGLDAPGWIRAKYEAKGGNYYAMPKF